jgi:hypothetical protein
MKTFDINAVKASVVSYFEEHFYKISADTLEWLAIIIIHCATIPTLLAMMTALSDRAPTIDVVLFAWGGLVLMFMRAILLKNSLNIITNGFGFITQAVIMAFILFK